MPSDTHRTKKQKETKRKKVAVVVLMVALVVMGGKSLPQLESGGIAEVTSNLTLVDLAGAKSFVHFTHEILIHFIGRLWGPFVLIQALMSL